MGFFKYDKYENDEAIKLPTTLKSGQESSKKCPYLEFFWSVFFDFRTKYGDLQSKSPYSVRMRENTDQNSEYGQFSFNANQRDTHVLKGLSLGTC